MLPEKLAAIYKGYWKHRVLTTRLALSRKNGFSDVNDYVDDRADNMAQRAMKTLFQDYGLKVNAGPILEVGSSTGRFTREIQKYIPQNVNMVCLEKDVHRVRFLKGYAKEKGWTNVTAVSGDYFNYDFENRTFEMVMIPWFEQLSLYQWAKVLEVGSKITKANGYFIFDFIDSQDSLIEAIHNIKNAHHYLINGSDVEKIANHFGFQKKFQYKIKFYTQTTTYFIYQKGY